MTHDTSERTPAQNNFSADRRRIRTRKQALLDLLLDREWHPNYECARVGGLSFHCSLYDLRQEGWKIESRKVKGGVWDFRLIDKTAAQKKRGELSSPQQRVADEFTLAVRKEYGDAGLERIRAHLAPWLTSRM